MVDGIWEKANEVSEIGYKIDGIANIAKLLGEATSDNVNSGVAWTIGEMLDIYTKRLEELSIEIMAINRVHNEVVCKAETKKAKKK